MTKTRTDCVEEIVVYFSNLNTITKCATDSIENCDFASAIDCLHKFYLAKDTVSAAFVMYSGVLEEDEILKYHQTLFQISKEFREKSIKLAKKCKSLPT
jgi:hypothetical protein